MLCSSNKQQKVTLLELLSGVCHMGVCGYSYVCQGRQWGVAMFDGVL